MKTFKEIFIERYKAEEGDDVDFTEAWIEDFFAFSSKVADEYKDQFIVKPETPIDNPAQTNLFHHNA